MLKTFKRTLSGLVCLLLGGGGLWFCATEPFEEEVEELPDYDWLEEIRGLQEEGRLGEAEQLADWVLDGSDITNRSEVVAVRDEIHEKRTAFWNRAYRAGKGFVVGEGTSIEELGGAVVSDFLLWGDIRDLAKQGWNKATGKETDPVVAGLAAVGVLTSVASYVPDPAEGAEVSADASFSLLKTLRKTGHLSRRFCDVLVDGCRKSVKTKSLTKGMKEIVVGMKGLFDGAGAARAAAIMKHVDDVDSLTAVSKMAKKAAEPAAILVRKHGAAGVDAIRELSKAEDGAEALAKAARKGPKGLKKILTYTKYGARTVKSVRLEHIQQLAKEIARIIIEALGRLPMAIVSGLLALLGLLQTKVWRIARIGCRQKPSAPPPASDAA